jgi:hypothetical protein
MSKLNDDFERRLAAEFRAYVDDGIGELNAAAVAAQTMKSGRRSVRNASRILMVASTVAAAAALTLVIGQVAAPTGASRTTLPLYPRDPGSYSLLGRMEGRLVLDGPCLIVQGKPVLLAWPSPGTKWDATSLTVTIYGVSARVGERVSVFGGMGNYGGNWLNPPPRECRQGDVWRVTFLRVVTGTTSSE